MSLSSEIDVESRTDRTVCQIPSAGEGSNSEYRLNSRAGTLKLMHQFEPDEAGRLVRKTKTAVIAPGHIWLEAVGRDDVGRVYWKLCWLNDGVLRERLEERSTVLAGSFAKNASTYGAPVTKGNEAKIQEYLLHAELYDTTVARIQIATQSGWAADWRRYVAGAQVIGEPAEVTTQDDPAWVAAHTSHGDAKEHERILLSIAEQDPVARLVVVTSLAALLLRPLGMRSNCISLWGPSGRGKSAILSAVVSAFGRPQRLVTTGDVSRAALYGTLARARDMAVPVDDSQLAAREDILEVMAYTAGAGMSASRATQTGDVRAAKEWLSILLVTGERPLLGHGAAAGARNRTLELEVKLMTQAQALAVHQGLDQHYGHVGPAFAAAMLTVVQDLPALRTQYREVAEKLKPEPDVAELSRQVAVLVLADILWRRLCLGEESPDAESIAAGQAVLKAATEGAAEVGSSVEMAYDAIQAFVAGHRHQLVKNATYSSDPNETKAGERVGYLLSSKAAGGWEFTEGLKSDGRGTLVAALLPGTVQKLAKEHKFNVRQLESELAQRALLIAGTNQKTRRVPADIDPMRPRALWVVLQPEVSA